MSEIVLDASAALSFLLPSQSTGASRTFLATRDADRFIAPHIFVWEVTNVLVRLTQRGAMTSGDFAAAIAQLDELEVELDPARTASEVHDLGRRALELGLRTFDTAYLLLALERGCGLASRDDRLLAVAGLSIPCFDLRGDQPS